MKKATVLTWVLVAAWGLTVGGCGKPAAEQPVLLAEELAEGDMVQFWTRTLPLDPGETIRHLYCRRDNLYVVSSTNKLRCMDSFSGRIKWTVKLCDEHIIPTSVGQLGSEVAYVAVIDKLYGFLTDTGQPLPPRHLKMAPSTNLTVTPKYVYFGTHEGWMQAEHVTNPAYNWDRLTHTPIIGAPVAAHGLVYFANEEGEVVASHDSRRQVEWTFKARDAFEADLRISGTRGLVLAACRDYSLYALNPIGGRPAWICTTGDPILQTPMVFGNRVYIITEPHLLMALNEANGERPLWSAQGIDRFLAASPRALYVLRRDGQIAALSHRDGAELFTLDARRLNVFALNEIDGQLFVAAPDGTVMAIREVKGKYDDQAAKEAAQEQPEEPSVLIE